MTAINNNNNIKTYRHEFSKEFMAAVSRFSKVHQFDDRHTYKSEWTKWAQQDNIAQAMEMEKRRLEENGYKGDIEDKMFKAGRYYFRKKTATPAETDQPLDADTTIVTTENTNPAIIELSAPDLPTATATATATPTTSTATPTTTTPTTATPTTATPTTTTPTTATPTTATPTTATPTTATPTTATPATTTPTTATPATPGLLSEASAVLGRHPPSTVLGRHPPPQHRRPYITMSKACIKMMDEHIRNASEALNSEFKPSSCYSHFYQTQMASDEMTKEIGHVIEKYEKTPGAMTNITPEDLTDQIMDKIKKTYKNRYYKYTSSRHNVIVNGNDK
jgi:hypothetical protein